MAANVSYNEALERCDDLTTPMPLVDFEHVCHDIYVRLLELPIARFALAREKLEEALRVGDAAVQRRCLSFVYDLTAGLATTTIAAVIAPHLGITAGSTSNV